VAPGGLLPHHFFVPLWGKDTPGRKLIPIGLILIRCERVFQIKRLEPPRCIGF
jgi:hypothetical protein